MSAQRSGAMRARENCLRKLNRKTVLWMTALIFLCNPNMHGLDILPDAVGYLLLLSAWRRLSLLDESFGEASRLFRRMAWLSVARLVGLVWIMAVPSPDEQPTLLLTLCFAVGVLELMTVLPACHQLFRGLSYLATRINGTVVFETAYAQRVQRIKQKLERLPEDDPKCSARRVVLERKWRRLRQTRDITDRACFACQAFAVTKTVLCILPEIAALSDATYRAGVTSFHWYAFVGGFRIMAIVIGGVIGIWWLIHMIRYCRKIETDEPFWCALARRCDEDERAHPERIPARHLKRARGYMVLACVFCLNFFVEGIDIFPNMLTPMLLLAAMIQLRSYISKFWGRVGTIYLTFHVLVSTLAYGFTTYFFLHYDLSAIHRSIQVQTMYGNVCIFAVVEAISMVLVLTMMSGTIVSMIRRFTGGHGAATFCYTKEQVIRVRQSQLRRHLFPILFFGVISAAAHVVYYYLLPEYDFVWMIDVFVTLLFVLFAWLRLRDLCDELDLMQMVSVKQ